MSELNFFGKLLDGIEIEWLPIGDIAEIYGGLTGKTKADFEKGNAKYISYKTIFGSLDINNIPTDCVDIREGERQHNVRYGDVLFTGSSEIAEEAGMSSAVTSQFDVPVYLNSFSFGVRFNDEIKIKPEFSKYLFRTSMMRTEIARTASGVTRFNISKARFKKVLIPVPCPGNPEKSLAIQSEIVRILDKFTALTAELTAELTARKKQYNYYRDQLLSFDEGNVEWKALEEVSDIYDSLHQTPQYAEIGLSMIRVTDIKNGYVDLNNTLKVNNEVFATFTKKYSPQKNDLVMSRVGSYGNVGIIPLDNSACMGQNTVVIHPRINSSYLFYILSSNIGQNFIERNVGGGSQKTLSLKSIKAIPIPLVSEKEQFRIASILGKFDTLTNSISEGLPREIELRQKQYEYYRDMLFSFPKPEVAEA
ncbi:type-1 restriction enzyme specificity protein [Enterobacter hormaechei]|uniref:restriction endonuclease subunit S n=1 Tax=Enterobacteriaceae TaxID=543 RepID=UPI000795EF9D|nr:MULTISPECIES: restriction endonuclease subunit S [Enterobacteriaceae]MBA7910344.1 restriction endonuclease subunit S [Enterobacter hormaechei]MEA1020133.1 restriction endonuclease subunit S [Enterobacter asburiae]WAR36676.1 restriction endonuclease subunit S [Citrobacter freundii]CZU71971.1 type-1 restriction enzyme specificity protein [Enterobacter hormaechei]CZW73292.1 type-1 restriction enzyme specificity protein [Enterobacter hormaechei]